MCKKKLLVLTALLFCSGLIFSQNQYQDSAWFRENYYKLERRITMRDGVKLFTSMYIPKDSTQKHPILMERTPYSCAPYGEDQYARLWQNYKRYYLREGYILVFQDVRGRWMSEGKFVDVRPFIKEKKSAADIDESTDAYDVIDWLVKNIPGNNGNVGVIGVSYPGFYAGMAAASGHPALKAVSPQAPVTDWFRGDDFHHNGVFFYMDAFDFYVSGGFGRPHPVPRNSETSMPDLYDSKDNYTFYLRQGADKNLLKYTGDSIAFYQELYQHPDEDNWWQARNARVAQYNIKPAILVTGGLFDAEDGYGAWNLYKAIRAQSAGTNARLVMGPWYHGQWETDDATHLGNVAFGSNTSVWYQNRIEIPFFNHYLKGNDDPSLARATIFFSGENKWRTFDNWPTEKAKTENLYLQKNGGLDWSAPKDARGYDEYVSDPAHPVAYTEAVHFNRTREYMTDDQRFAERRADVLSYQTPILTEDLTLGGPVIADLRTSISTTDADFVVKLIDVFPDTLSYQRIDIYASSEAKKAYPMGGYEMLVRAEIFRGKYRNSFEKPEPFKPGNVETVRFTLPDVAHTFKKGHRLMVQIQSTWFPLADRNPQRFTNIYTCNDTDFQKATIRIFHDKDHPSALMLPIIP
ncbi:MAG: CocE/NonD family hydrolase [Bacteroidota bacterium]|nr:CocE/NonD family hydrolase [Bacteroidota bacterium]MDP4250728.1 CocE/NonD family hydrolase [Bacteroidota bacterium]